MMKSGSSVFFLIYLKYFVSMSFIYFSVKYIYTLHSNEHFELMFLQYYFLAMCCNDKQLMLSIWDYIK